MSLDDVPDALYYKYFRDDRNALRQVSKNVRARALPSFDGTVRVDEFKSGVSLEVVARRLWKLCDEGFPLSKLDLPMFPSESVRDASGTSRLENLVLFPRADHIRHLTLRYVNLSNVEEEDLRHVGAFVSLKSFSLKHSKVSSLRGIECATRLEAVEIKAVGSREDFKAFDFSSLSRLPNLRELELKNLGVTNVEHLSGCASLQKLTLLELERVKSLTPLRRLTGLRELELEYMHKIKNLDFLDGSVQLTSLRVYNTSVNDVSSLPNLTNLQQLHFGGSESDQIADIEPLSLLPSLRELQCWEMFEEVDTFEPLASLTALTCLHLASMNHNLEDVSFVSSMSDLRELSLARCCRSYVKDITPLQHLTRLTSLELGFSFVRDLSPLSTLKNLRYIEMTPDYLTPDGEEVEGKVDLTPLTTLTNLEKFVTDASASSFEIPPGFPILADAETDTPSNDIVDSMH